MLEGNKIERLEKLDFDWNPEDADWNAMFDRLANFKKKFDNTLVPDVFGEDQPLGTWVHHQCVVYGKHLSSIVDEYDDDFLWSLLANELQSSKLSNQTHFDRMKKPIDIDFVWDALEAKWMEMCQRLVEYKKLQNSTTLLVSTCYLAEWEDHQRSAYVIRKLSPQRIEVLNYIDFVWDPLDARWNEVFEKLVEYTKKKKNGSTMAPQNYKQDPELGSWVVKQRLRKKAKRLSAERIDKLDSIGSVWAPRETME
jgi:hypothetical protein